MLMRTQHRRASSMDASDPAGKSVYDAAQAVHAAEAHKLTDKHGLAAARTPGTLHWQGCECAARRVASSRSTTRCRSTGPSITGAHEHASATAVTRATWQRTRSHTREIGYASRCLSINGSVRAAQSPAEESLRSLRSRARWPERRVPQLALAMARRRNRCPDLAL